jgi:transglutaminase-like putative cysteine protease
MLRPRENRDVRVTSSDVRDRDNLSFRNSDDEWTDLGALTVQHYPALSGRLSAWARLFVRGNRTDTLALLKDLSAGVSQWVRYQSREDEGTQSPVQTLDCVWCSCRDLAVLFVEAAPHFSFGARIVSGYIFNPDQSRLGLSGAASTHAWGKCSHRERAGSASTQ